MLVKSPIHPTNTKCDITQISYDKNLFIMITICWGWFIKKTDNKQNLRFKFCI